MATLSITKNYADGEVLLEADLDEIKGDIETFLNTTKINDDNIQNGGITGSTKLADNTVTAGKLAADSVTTAKIVDDAVTAAKIADGAIDDAAKLASNVVTTAKILDSNVTTAKIADSNVTTAKIADSNVTTAKIADSNVTTAKIADGAVTNAKRASPAYGSAALSSIGSGNAAIASVTITGSGRPVLITVMASRMKLSTDSESSVANAGSNGILYLRRNGTNLVNLGQNVFTASPVDFTYIDTTGASGSLTYDLYKTDTSGITVAGVPSALNVIEL